MLVQISCVSPVGQIPCASVDVTVAQWFQARHSDGFIDVMQVLSALASGMAVGIALGVALLVLAFRRRWFHMAVLTTVVAGGSLLSEVLKLITQRARPLYAGDFVDWAGYSFPSGHTICATLVYGGLALWLLPRLDSRLWRTATVVFASVMIILVALSRVALNAHYVTDVLAAIALGLIWLKLCSTTSRRVAVLVRRDPITTRATEANSL